MLDRISNVGGIKEKPPVLVEEEYAVLKCQCCIFFPCDEIFEVHLRGCVDFKPRPSERKSEICILCVHRRECWGDKF